MALRTLRTRDLDLAFDDAGPAAAEPVVLLHGFPYDPRSYDAVVARLTRAGYRTIVPYLRGYGPTRFLSPGTPRSGQQAALAQDLLDLLDGLALSRAALVGFDWGGRAACIVAALFPERVRFLISMEGYNIQDIARMVEPGEPEQELRYWYQYYFNTERGRRGLERNRREIGRLLWRLWSPTWRFDDQTYDQTAASFANPDFVAVAIHSYRHRYGAAAGDPRYDEIELRLAEQPAISVPTLVLHGADDGVIPAATSLAHYQHFTGAYERREIEGAGHNLPQEKPEVLAGAILELLVRYP
jgi:pimeloyl-ACP methyl ester carboxylesterase